MSADLENLFSNSHSHDKYLWQVSLKSIHYAELSCHTNRLLTDGQQTDAWGMHKTRGMYH